MTLAEIREILLRELAACALAGSETVDFSRGGPRSRVLRRIGKPLVLRHVHPGKRIRFQGGWLLLQGDVEVCVVERAEAEQVLFEQPRVMISTVDFLNAVVKGAAVDV